MGGDLDEMVDIQSVNHVTSDIYSYGHKHLHRGDLNENDNFEY